MTGNGENWDKPVVPMLQLERQLLSEADVRRSSARRRVMTEAGRKRNGSCSSTIEAKLLREPAEAGTAQVR